MSLSTPVSTQPFDLYITDELARRIPAKPNYLREKRAIQALAATMANEPAKVLPRFVDLAMELTGGVSAGLSLYESDPAPGVFRWQFLRGTLEPFNNATTPRNFSPCGITLDQNRPVLSLHPERMYTWISDANIVVPEVLLVPLHIGSAEPIGTLWIVSGREGHFDAEHARIAEELAAFVSIALQMVKTQQHLVVALEEQETLAKEMSHRVKNVFALIDGMIRASARSSTTKEDLATAISGRVHALAHAHTLVRRNFGPDDNAPEVADLHELMHAVMQPHNHGDQSDLLRLAISGPTVKCLERAANGIALLIHEMATNAAKYGALSTDQGRISVLWRIEEERLILDWVETGGPKLPSPPTRQGFGSKLAAMTVERQLGGKLDYHWAPSGLSVTIDIPTAALLA